MAIVRMIRGDPAKSGLQGVNRMSINGHPFGSPAPGTFGGHQTLAIVTDSDNRSFLITRESEAALRDAGYENVGANVPYTGTPLGQYLRDELNGDHDRDSPEARIGEVVRLGRSTGAWDVNDMYFPN